MSGGYFNHKDVELKSTIFGYQGRCTNVFEDLEVSKLTFDLLDLIHTFDLYTSGDTVKETYTKAKTNFKKKWMNNRGIRVKRIVDEAIQDSKQELYETYGLEDEE